MMNPINKHSTHDATNSFDDRKGMTCTYTRLPLSLIVAKLYTQNRRFVWKHADVLVGIKQVMQQITASSHLCLATLGMTYTQLKIK